LKDTDYGDDEDDEDDEDEDDDDDYENGVIELPKIKNIWESEKIKKRGTKNEKGEGWICHWYDKDFRVCNNTKALHHATAVPKQNM
jgi:hypothetical protein